MHIYKTIACSLYFFVSLSAMAQEPIEPVISEEIKNQLENMTEENEDVAPDDDSYFQAIEFYLRHPINLNNVYREQLMELRILSEMQISNFMIYRKLFGNLVSIYELQAIPGWDITTIKKLLPFIKVSVSETLNTFRNRLKNGEHTMLIRHAIVLEKSEGFLRDQGAGMSYYAGDRNKILLRYKYQFKNQLQYGITAEKDAGEQFLKNRQGSGFDFYSAHFFVRDIGNIKVLALGDFVVNFGQGLIQWQGLTFGKGPETIQIKRQAETIRPYNSAGEIVFNRGIGITLEKKQWRSTVYASSRKIDGRFEPVGNEILISSMPLTGYHRTPTENAGKNVLGLFNLGGNIEYNNEKLHVGFNTVQYFFDYPVAPKEPLYQLYNFSGKRLSGYSLDAGYTFKNVHLFGETAMDMDLNKAIIIGAAYSASNQIEVNILHRSFSPKYQSLYANAFSESSGATNETGTFVGMVIRPATKIKISGYADVFSFSWLKYRVDAPSKGYEYMVEAALKTDKNNDLYVRYRLKSKGLNTKTPNVLNEVENYKKQNIRLHFNVKLSQNFNFRARGEMAWFDHPGQDISSGFMIYSDLLYKPIQKKWSANTRIAFFSTDSYDSRLYAFENDVLYSYSIPVFSGKGLRYYLNVKYKYSSKLTLWMRIAQSYYPNQEFISSGLDKIQGNKKTEIKTQLLWTL